MTTQYKITRADLTADASQNREHKHELIHYRGHRIEVYSYRDYDGTWIKDCAIDGEFSPCEGVAARGNLTVEQAKQIIDEITFEDESTPGQPAKPAHTLENYGSGYPYSEHDKLTVALAETAAERDRLKQQLANSIPLDVYLVLKKQRDTSEKQEAKAREQVKTLLAVAQAFTATIFSENDNPQQMLRELVQFKRQFRAAIANVESEQAK